jgi:hypothetical protein
MKINKIEGLCRCGTVISNTGVPCDHCDDVCLLKKCKKCKRLLDSSADAGYYDYQD